MPLQQPPRDENGNVIPHNHAGIQAEDGVIRRISTQWIVIDEKTGLRRLSSMAFQPSSGPNGGMSVDLEQSISAVGLDPRKYVTSPRWMGSVRFEAGTLRREGFLVGYGPLPENPHHGEVWGSFSKSKKRKLQELCTWFVPIENVSII